MRLTRLRELVSTSPVVIWNGMAVYGLLVAIVVVVVLTAGDDGNLAAPTAGTELVVVTPEPAPTAAPTPTPEPEPMPTVTPIPSQAEPLNFVVSFTGRGKQLSPKFSLAPGKVYFTVEHDGRAVFAVTLIDGQGNRTKLIDEIGPFDGVKSITLEKANTFALDITADGRWTILVRHSGD